MKNRLKRTINYGNWIRRRRVYTFLGIGLILFLLSLFPFQPLLSILSIATASVLIAMGSYLAYISYQFSDAGGDFQQKLWQVVLDHLNWNGNGHALDIGTGNGPLAIRLAKEYPNALVTGIDFWGSDWEYAKITCEQNASFEGVSERTEFRKATASHLPFDDEQFDAVVSNFVFHEVADASDKRDVVQEALRVLRKGGSFSFQDMFLDETLYGRAGDLVEAIQDWGIQEVIFKDTHEILPIPPLLNSRRVLGYCSIIYGKK